MTRAAHSARAALATDPPRFVVESDEAATPASGEVRVRVEACGICGTDLHYWGSGLLPPGHTPGHEIAGRIEAVGPSAGDVQGPVVGEAVAVEPLRCCGTCERCRAGQDSICRSMRLLGVHLPGGLAEHVVIPAERAHPIDATVDPAVAAMTEPMAVAVHGLARGGLEKGQRVLVLGAGAVGLVTLLAARALGAGEVFVTARYGHQAERARGFGATRVLDEGEADASALDRLGRERDFDLVVETVGGRADTLRAAVAAARPGGAVSVLGVFMDKIELEPLPLLVKELDLRWSNCYHRPPGERADFERAARIVEAERERLATLVTHRFGLDGVNDAFRIASQKSSGALKVSVLPAS